MNRIKWILYSLVIYVWILLGSLILFNVSDEKKISYSLTYTCVILLFYLIKFIIKIINKYRKSNNNIYMKFNYDKCFEWCKKNNKEISIINVIKLQDEETTIVKVDKELAVAVIKSELINATTYFPMPIPIEWCDVIEKNKEGK